jgi:hypothetical protein
MKTMITTAMAALLSLGAAKANSLNSNSTKNANHAVASATSYVSVAALSEENANLKWKLAAMAEETAELKSLLDYERMMNVTIDNLENVVRQEKEEEMQALVSYNNLMTKVLLKLPKAE